MKRWFPTLLVFAVCSAVVHADVTVVETMTIEGGMAAMGQSTTPKTTTRIKGLKSRTDVDASGDQVSTITDLVAKQVILLRPDQKTAQIISKADALAAPAGTALPAAPATDATLTPTGRTQTIDGLKCDEFAFTSSLEMSDMAASHLMPPEAAEMMKDVKMKIQGTVCVAKDAPGASEYLAFQKAAASSELDSAVAGASGMNMNVPGMEKMMKALGAVQGMPYVTEMTVNVEGTGQVAQMMQQAGPMKITMRVSSVTTDAVADDLFKMPEGYTIIKP
ncbi:MAG: hypothetical protein ACRD1V_17470 [Vicinamibacterales bacterium]